MIGIFIIALTVTGALIIRSFVLRLGVRHDTQTGTAAPARTRSSPLVLPNWIGRGGFQTRPQDLFQRLFQSSHSRVRVSAAIETEISHRAPADRGA